jgi:probable rRNA maturation factor
MGHAGPTDVLSFPMLPPDAFPAHTGRVLDLGRADKVARVARPFALPPRRRVHLGDVVISVERAAAQAAEGRGGQTGDVAWSARDELRLLAIHGVLHVCGWDHARPEEEAAMRRLEQDLLESR